MTTASGSFEPIELFSVPFAVVRDVVEEKVVAAAAAWLRAEAAATQGIERANRGGWHSSPDLPARGVAVIDTLCAAIVDHVTAAHVYFTDGQAPTLEPMIQAWGTSMTAGDYVDVHDHADAHWSAVLYVDSGDGPGSAHISFHNPSGGHRSTPGPSLAPTTFTVAPEAGMLLLFPGWLRHSVAPYLGNRPRLAIAANVDLRARPEPVN